MSTNPLTREQSRRVDQIATNNLGFPSIVLMENAGRGAADVIERIADGRMVLVACGSGNNAGDGFVVARHLALRGSACRVVLVGSPEKLYGDALTAYRMLQSVQAPALDLYAKPEAQVRGELDRAGGGHPVLVDALLGTGATGDPRPPYDQVILWMNDQDATRIALDVPTGLDCDTGVAGEPTFCADHTCTFYASKQGYQRAPAARYVGAVHVVSIGIPEVTL